MLTIQDKVENILKDDPKMATSKLIRAYLRGYTAYNYAEIEKFMEMLRAAYIPSLTRYAAKYREKLGIRDSIRQQMAETESRQQSQTPMLEVNPPQSCDSLCSCVNCSEDDENVHREDYVRLQEDIASGLEQNELPF